MQGAKQATIEVIWEIDDSFSSSKANRNKAKWNVTRDTESREWTRLRDWVKELMEKGTKDNVQVTGVSTWVSASAL